jgi:hypothetical protein
MTMEERIKALEAQIAELKGEKPEPSKPWVRVDPLDRVYAQQGIGGQLPEWMQDMARAVDDDVVRAIVGDHTRSRVAQPAVQPPVDRGTGWAPMRPLEPPPGQRHIEAIAEAFDKKDRERATMSGAMSPQSRSELAILNAKVQKLQERIEVLEAQRREEQRKPPETGGE